MRSTFAAFALSVGLAVAWTRPALAQEFRPEQDQPVKLLAPRALADLTRAARLATSAWSDTLFVGHMVSATPTSDNPFCIGAVAAGYRPGRSWDACWDFDHYNGGLVDSLQGWTPIVRPNVRTSGTIPDVNRPWFCLDWGNRLNATPVQGRTVGIVGVWHVDGGINVPPVGQVAGASCWWAPLAGNASVWCGLRAGQDVAYLDDVSRGGTGNPINGDCLWGEYWNGTNYTAKLFPGYAHRWDQLLYRDVRVAAGATLTVRFQYQTHLSPLVDNTAATGCGWFNLDPLSVVEGGTPVNFISNSSSANRAGPVDSFMVYVGAPTDPTACVYSDGTTGAIYDVQRRWFSEVLRIDQPYVELLSAWGQDSAYRATPFSVTLDATTVTSLTAPQGAADGGGVLRVVFRSKTNKNYADESGTGGTFNSRTQGAVRVDEVGISTDGGVTWAVASGFESPSEIDNRVEAENGDTPGPVVGSGYALGAWHATGKPPKLYSHTHPLLGGDIGGGNVYEPLAWNDICGSPESDLRQCNMTGVVVSTGDHDLHEAAGGAWLTPFQQNINGIMSPTINMVTPAGSGNDDVPNNMGISRYYAETWDDWYVRYDVYLGIFDLFADGNVWGHWQVNYPALQANGAKVWSDLVTPSSVWYNPDRECYWTDADISPLIRTSNESGFPDSIRLVFLREQRCISFGVTTGCSPTGGHYYDNISFYLPPPLYYCCGNRLELDIWHCFQDAFPFNETEGLPGTAAFDTCAALIKTGLNTAANTGDALRFDVPGDSICVYGQNWTGDPMRVDMVFRIYPGPGNYVMPGNRASGLRKVPTSTEAATAGDGSFWGAYMADPGPFAKGTHTGGWSVDTWNSARCDTAERNMFLTEGRAMGLSYLAADDWISTYHEEDPKFATLGILRNKCFLVDTAATASLYSDNITCGSVPAWVTTLPPGYTGWDGNQQTREFTKIIPDGVLTPGSHVQYFFRLSFIGMEQSYVMTPDTNMIGPQRDEGPNYDGHRWQQFGVLPDRWKDATYEGVGSACILVVENADRRGAERAWVSIADSIGLTAASKYGAHNGWHCSGSYVSPSDGTHDYWDQRDCGTNPNIAVWRHGGQAGTVWDLYQVKGAEGATTPAGGIGSRLANRANMGYLTGKESRQGPTPEMLRAYYKLIILLSGDLNSQILGPVVNKGSDDVAILEDFLAYDANMNHPRGLWVNGRGFAESEAHYGTGTHLTFLNDYLGTDLRDEFYFRLSGNETAGQRVATTLALTGWQQDVGFPGSCKGPHNVLAVNTDVIGATAGAYYENVGTGGPYVASVVTPSNTRHPYVTVMDALDLGEMTSPGGTNSLGRIVYTASVLMNALGTACGIILEGPLDVPPEPARAVDFLGDVWGNPVTAGGRATVHFGLASAGRAQVRVYDVAGRLVRTLANRDFAAGEHKLVWDGADDQNRAVGHGVYFVRVSYPGSRFEGARKVVLLR